MAVTQKELAQKALAEIEAHERECLVRFQNIERRLDSGAKNFEKLERLIFGLYAIVLGSVLLPILLKMG
jgi:hypothetical protein